MKKILRYNFKKVCCRAVFQIPEIQNFQKKLTQIIESFEKLKKKIKSP
jgi:hypothetical protein